MKSIHKIQYLLLLLCSAVIGGCNSTESRGPITDGTQVEAKATVRTNVSDTLDAFAANTVIGIFMESSLPDLSAANYPYYTAEGGKKACFFPVAANQTLYYPINGDPVNFIAYAPYHTEAATGYIPVNLSEQDSLSTLDLLYAGRVVGKSATDPEVWFLFRHVLSKLHFSLYAGEGFSDENLMGMQVTVRGISTRASFSVMANSLTEHSSPTDSIHITPNRQLTAEAIVLPIDQAGGIELAFTLQQHTLRYILPAGQSFLPGTQYNYTVKINNPTDPGPSPEPSLEIVCSISDWKNEDREIDLQ